MGQNCHSKSSKPTQAQGLCGLTRCYTDGSLSRFFFAVIP